MNYTDMMAVTGNDLVKLTFDETKYLYKKLQKITQQRARRLRNAINVQGLIQSAALNILENSGGTKIGAVKGKVQQRAAMQRAIQRMQKFMGAKTSTIKGLKDYAKNVAELTTEGYNDWTERQRQDFWAIIDRLREERGNTELLAPGYESGRTISQIAEMYEQGDLTDRVLDGSASYDEIIQAMKQYRDENDIASAEWEDFDEFDL